MTLETGTQGSFVEIDSSFYKRSEGRSRFDMREDVKHTARPVPPQKSILFISQTAIPGKEKKQYDMRQKLAKRGYTVITAAHDGFEIDGLTASHSGQLKNALEKRGYTVRPNEDGGLAIDNMPIHAPGHGYVEDFKEWLKLVNPIFPMLQHTGDINGVIRFKEVVPATLGREGHYVENFERMAAERASPVGRRALKVVSHAKSPARNKPATPDDNREGWKLVSLGRSIPSLILVEIIRKIREYHSGPIKATRYIKFDGQGGLTPDGLMASVRENGTYRQHFASVDNEVTRHGPVDPTGKRPEPVLYNRVRMMPERLYRGPNRPDKDLYELDAGRRGCAA
jgi:hypothetical protein